MWQIMIARLGDDILAYIWFQLQKISDNLVRVIINECRITSKLSSGSSDLDFLIYKFLDFLQEEAMESTDEIKEIHLNLSMHHRIVEHLLKSEDISLKNRYC